MMEEGIDNREKEILRVKERRDRQLSNVRRFPETKEFEEIVRVLEKYIAALMFNHE
ncbi:MAG: hypothetical protein WCV58_03485 [Patescibacteria group bacterium]|jgi:hypothetical protein